MSTSIFPLTINRLSSRNKSVLKGGTIMNICIATDLFPPEGGGSERSTYFLAKGLAKRGHNILIVMPHFGQKTVYEEHKWFKIIRFRYLRAPNVPVFRNIVKNELFYIYMAQKLKKILIFLNILFLYLT